MKNEVDITPAFEPGAKDSTSREAFYALDEGSGEVSLAHVSTGSDVVSSYVRHNLAKGTSITSCAARAWWSANGDLEHRHTCGIYVKEFKTKKPVLFVYIDTSSMLQDFTTNKNLYLQRLAQHSFEVSDIKFLKSRKKKQASTLPPRTFSRPLPRLSAEEDAAIEAACKDLPCGLRERVSRAMKLIHARNKE